MQEYRVKAEIDCEAIRHNYQAMRAHFGAVKIMSVLKADAYGHGVGELAPVCDPLTDYFAIATFEEGQKLRLGGAKKPVLLLGSLPEDQIAKAAEIGLSFSVGSVWYAQTVNEVLRKRGLRGGMHIKLDTGMNRAGIRYRRGRKEEALCELRSILAMDCLQTEGIYTHLPCSDSEDLSDIAFTQEQLTLYREACQELESEGHELGLKHCYSTGGSLAAQGELFDMVRIGMMIYGQCDTAAHQSNLGLKEALRWTSRIVQIETLPAGEFVSYGRTFQAERDMKIGVVSCGYADGYRRSYQTILEVLAGGGRCRILGRICMDFMIIDLSEVPEPFEGMEVTLLGTQGREHISAIEIASRAESTCGEVTAAINARVPRIYINK